MLFADLINAYIKGRRYAIAARCYFDWEEDGSVRFKGGNAEHTLTGCYETGKWRCSCPKYTARKFCAHTFAAKRSLPAPVLVVVQ